MAASIVRAADLFCGAGGTSTGLLRAAQRLGRPVDLLAVNHWRSAINTHTLNHPGVRHLCEDLGAIDPRRAIPDGRLDLLLASPECTSHSYSRGGRPVSEQSRATAWHPVKWMDQLQVGAAVIENVEAFTHWGPTDRRGRPIRERRGETYRQYLAMIESLGYTVDARVLNAADYGAATTRKRLFLIAVKGKRRIRWPEPTHAKGGAGGLKPWRAAREVIDLADVGESIFGRKRPLAPKTMERIFMGLERFGGPTLQPIVAILRRHATGRSIDDPLPPACAGGQQLALATPVIVQAAHGDNPKGSGRGNGGRVRSVDDTLPTIHGRGLGVAQFVVVNRTHNTPKSVDEPMPVLNTGENLGLVDARFLLPHRVFQEMRVDSIDQPLRTLDSASDDIGVVSPVVTDGKTERPLEGAFLIPFFGERGAQRPRTHSIDEPMPTPTSHGAGALTSYLVKYFGTAIGQSIDQPIGTLTGKARYGLVTPYGVELADGLYLDIRFRMLKIPELGGGMGFARDYRFYGTKSDQVKQIGNAVEVHQAEALTFSVLS
jgi:DNA (cytosine-5)-methyltransferase 1